ncbi:glycosyltransferase family 4 protein [Fulvivirgaceae bacterium BMA12]|uniref:Glycosyltransferase family 4 protein n=1 Tax=Agaribacillus aureus TaxID=3051825 RepID=A0ABT8LF11_9BACT|nr:glycosyltransferase family 4 protein [Fulvivirgaceae bacterium BMA12]
MKILYIHQYFKTPEEGGAIRSYYLAQGLAEHGYEVEMVTSHNKAKYEKKNIDGLIVHYLPVSYDNAFGFLKRIVAFIKFYRLAYKKIKSIPKADVIYATSTPLTVGLLALRLKRRLKIPYYFEVRDLWPEAPIQMGVIKNWFLKNWLVRLEKRIYQGADKIIALSPGIRDHIIKVVPNKPIYIIPNMSDCKFFNLTLKNKKLEEEIGFKDKFIIGYFGAIGRVNKLDYFLDFMEMLNKATRNVAFLIVGKGGDLPGIKEQAKKRGIRNLKFLPFQNKEGIRHLLSAMDATYISFDQKPVLETNSPNKYFDALAAGKLVITNTNGWVREMVETHQCGFYADPQNPKAIYTKLKPFFKDPNLLLKYQKNARNLAELYYSREIQVQKLISIFNNEYHLKINEESVYILTA